MVSVVEHTIAVYFTTLPAPEQDIGVLLLMLYRYLELTSHNAVGFISHVVVVRSMIYHETMQSTSLLFLQ